MQPMCTLQVISTARLCFFQLMRILGQLKLLHIRRIRQFHEKCLQEDLQLMYIAINGSGFYQSDPNCSSLH